MDVWFHRGSQRDSAEGLVNVALVNYEFNLRQALAHGVKSGTQIVHKVSSWKQLGSCRGRVRDDHATDTEMPSMLLNTNLIYMAQVLYLAILPRS